MVSDREVQFIYELLLVHAVSAPHASDASAPQSIRGVGYSVAVAPRPSQGSEDTLTALAAVVSHTGGGVMDGDELSRSSALFGPGLTDAVPSAAGSSHVRVGVTRVLPTSHPWPPTVFPRTLPASVALPRRQTLNL